MTNTIIIMLSICHPQTRDIVNQKINRYHFDPVTRSSSEMPDTIFTAGVRIRIVGAADFAMWRGDFVLATAFLAVVFVLVQREPVIAHALVRSWCVFALVLTTTVIDGALVHVCQKNAS